ncbi:MAG: glycosyltransferase [Solirubrobacteraceae bacterium]
MSMIVPNHPLTSDVPIAPLPIERFQSVLDDAAYRDLLQLREDATALLRGRAVWCVNSTARGGGVAEMLRSLLAYTRGAGVDTRWSVIGGTPEFFAVTKRLHNRLHGNLGDGGPLGPAEREIYDAVLAAAGDELAQRVQPGDMVLLHDPQTAGLASRMRAAGAHVVWRSHVGIDTPDDATREAWDFLRPEVADVEAFVFSQERFVWSGLEDRPVTIIAPSIDVFSSKNQELAPDTVRAILAASGLCPDGVPAEAIFTREDGTPGRVERRAHIVEEQPLTPQDRIVTQVSRWDRLKDPVGVLHGFVAHAGECCDAHLVIAGPAMAAVADDPEGADALAEVVLAWRELPPGVRRRVHLASLDMTDAEENGAVVNALQTRADVVVQKSLAEGFGLTVAEAMWKARPVVASGVGGIQEQVVDEVCGLVLDDPTDLAAFGHAICRLLGDPELAARLGAAARERVHERFLEPRHLDQWVAVMRGLIENEAPSQAPALPAAERAAR